MRTTEAYLYIIEKQKPSADTNQPMAFKKQLTNMRKKTLPCEARMAILLYIKYLES